MTPRLFHGVQSYPCRQPSLVVIGNFDGVHRGHQHVLQSASSLARRDGLLPLVLTFDPHPAEVLSNVKLSRLTSLPRKVELLLAMAPELSVVVEPFRLELARMSPEQFARSVLSHGLLAQRVVVGQDFRFGHQRAGDLTTLKQLGDGLGFQASAEDLAVDSVGPYSSTRVRDALQHGNVGEAARLLGRPHALTGNVVQGDQRGRDLGFPTANLGAVEELTPLDGVYGVLVDVEEADGFSRLRAGALNIGKRPTVHGGRAIEVHLLDFSGDLYGRQLRVHLLERLRDEQRFASLAELVAQLEVDVSHVRAQTASYEREARASGAWF